MEIKSKFLNFIKYLCRRIHNKKSCNISENVSTNKDVSDMLEREKKIAFKNISEENTINFNNRRCNIGKMLLRPINLKKGKNLNE